MLFRSRRSSASVSPTLPTASRRLSCGSFCRTSRLAAAAQAIGELRCLFVCFFAVFVCALTRWSAVRVYKVPRCHIRAGTGPAPATSAPGLRCACSTFNVLVGAAGASAPVAECTSFERKSTKGLQARTARASASAAADLSRIAPTVRPKRSFATRRATCRVSTAGAPRKPCRTRPHAAKQDRTRNGAKAASGIAGDWDHGELCERQVCGGKLFARIRRLVDLRPPILRRACAPVAHGTHGTPGLWGQT